MAKNKIFSPDELRKEPGFIQTSFFDALLEWRESDKSPIALKGKPGSQFLQYHDGPWHATNTWYVGTSPCTNSGGEIRICHDGKLVWMMTFFGACAPEVVPFLNEALLYNYRRRVFNGGRGQEKYVRDGFMYSNTVSEGSSFKNFNAEETVRVYGELKGEYSCNGGLMI